MLIRKLEPVNQLLSGNIVFQVETAEELLHLLTDLCCIIKYWKKLTSSSRSWTTSSNLTLTSLRPGAAPLLPDKYSMESRQASVILTHHQGLGPTEHVSTQAGDGQLVTLVSPLPCLPSAVSQCLSFLEIRQSGPGILQEVCRHQLHVGLLVLDK